MISFEDLNKNLNEYNLITKIIDYSGKRNTLYDEYERLLTKYNCKLYNNLQLYNENLSIEFIREFKDILNWESISKKLQKSKYNTVEFIREFKDELNWCYIRIEDYDPNPIDLIREFQIDMYWINLSNNLEKYNLNTIEFIREFKDKVKWYYITDFLLKYNFNKIDFIREFQDELNWDIITKKLEEWNLNKIDFIREFKYKINWKYIINSKEDYEKYKDIIDIKNKIYYKVKYQKK
jgi:hypothetical protein